MYSGKTHYAQHEFCYPARLKSVFLFHNTKNKSVGICCVFVFLRSERILVFEQILWNQNCWPSLKWEIWTLSLFCCRVTVAALLLSPTTTPKSATSFNFPFFLPFSAVGDDRIAALLSVNKAAMTKQMMSHRYLFRADQILGDFNHI